MLNFLNKIKVSAITDNLNIVNIENLKQEKK